MGVWSVHEWTYGGVVSAGVDIWGCGQCMSGHMRVLSVHEWTYGGVVSA